MKKVLIASTALLLTGGAALADVTIGGNGRFGLLYQETDLAGDNETTISMRLRFNIDASKETDSGVTFGGRIRLQYDNGDAFSISNSFNDSTTGEAGAELSAAKVYATYGGMRVEAGNVDTAYDSAALMYNSEIGFLDSSAGDPQGSYYSFSSGPYSADEANRMGVYFSYSLDAFNVRLSWVNGDQTRTADDEILTETQYIVTTDAVTGNTIITPVQVDVVDTAGNPILANEGLFEDEYGISADYAFGAFTVSAAAVTDGAGIDGNDNYFIGGEYAIGDMGAVGLQFFDNGDTNGDLEGDRGNQFTLYGNYKVDAVVIKGYIANNDADSNEDDTVYGIGADYDLGGASLSGSVRSGYDGNYGADIGVRFSF